MKKLIIPTMDALVAYLQQHAAPVLGIPPESIYRTYTPTASVERLEERENQTGEIIVYPQDCDENKDEEVVAGVTKTVSCAVALINYVPKLNNSGIDPLVEKFEDLQNLFVGAVQWIDDGQGYTVANTATADIVNPAILEGSNVALSRIDVEIDTFAASELE